jgi:hypothetical protein
MGPRVREDDGYYVAAPSQRRNAIAAARVIPPSKNRRPRMTKTITPVPEDNKCHKGPGSEPQVALDTTRGHRDDEKHNIREQGDHGNLVQNTSNRRSG